MGNYEYTYMMLSRLKMDNEYFLGCGNRHEKHLWAGNIVEQINEMKKLYSLLPDDKKPEWLTIEDINNFENAMFNS